MMLMKALTLNRETFVFAVVKTVVLVVPHYSWGQT